VSMVQNYMFFRAASLLHFYGVTPVYSQGWYPVLDVGREAWGVVLESPLVVQFLFGAGSALCG
jgi:hypothetical protein